MPFSGTRRSATSPAGSLDLGSSPARAAGSVGARLPEASMPSPQATTATPTNAPPKAFDLVSNMASALLRFRATKPRAGRRSPFSLLTARDRVETLRPVHQDGLVPIPAVVRTTGIARSSQMRPALSGSAEVL